MQIIVKYVNSKKNTKVASLKFFDFSGMLRLANGQ